MIERKRPRSKPGRKPATDDNRKISISAQIPLNDYNKMCDLIERQGRSISSIMNEAIHTLVNGETPNGTAPKRPKVFGAILAALVKGEEYLLAIESISNAPGQIVSYARKLPQEKLDLLYELEPEMLQNRLTSAEQAQFELAYLQARHQIRSNTLSPSTQSFSPGGTDTPNTGAQTMTTQTTPPLTGAQDE